MADRKARDDKAQTKDQAEAQASAKDAPAEKPKPWTPRVPNEVMGIKGV